jgi:hypothetical protein
MQLMGFFTDLNHNNLPMVKDRSRRREIHYQRAGKRAVLNFSFLLMVQVIFFATHNYYARCSVCNISLQLMTQTSSFRLISFECYNGKLSIIHFMLFFNIILPFYRKEEIKPDI